VNLAIVEEVEVVDVVDEVGTILLGGLLGVGYQSECQEQEGE
jgi:hypothetical protein